MACCSLNEYIVAFFNVMFLEWEPTIMTNLPIDSKNEKKTQDIDFCIAQYIVENFIMEHTYTYNW
jgi:hypothetical protein